MRLYLILAAFIASSCHNTTSTPGATVSVKDSVPIYSETKPALAKAGTGGRINTGNTDPAALISFAKSLIGTKYKYGSTDPVNGFDCSGFITYVFNHFNITVPRSSVDFTDYDSEVGLHEAKPGDLILFTGTDSSIREVGHMGIITMADNNTIEFIHSTSGKAYGVTLTLLNDYYRGRFVKVIRVF